MSSVAEKIQVMQAHQAGKVIRYRRMCENREWTRALPYANLAWNWDDWEYEVAPEPREWWVVEVGEGIVVSSFNSREKADKGKIGWNNASVIRVREVIED